MNRTNWEHAFYALLMQLPFGLLGHWWMGAVFGIAFFLGREHAQYEKKLKQNGAFNGFTPFAAFAIWRWSLDAQLDLACPVVAVVVVASVVARF
jgi:hypothetical protein